MRAIGESRPKDAAILKTMLFSFNDLPRLHERARALLFDRASIDIVVMALRGTDADFRNAVLSSMPSRGRRLVEGELNSGASRPARDVAKARKAIADIVLGMAARNEIELGGPARRRGGVSAVHSSGSRAETRRSMSGDVDHEDKTEEPTEKRLHDAVEQGRGRFLPRGAAVRLAVRGARRARSSSSPAAPRTLLLRRSSASSTTRPAGASRAAKTCLLSPALSPRPRRDSSGRSWRSWRSPASSPRSPRPRRASCPTASCRTSRASRRAPDCAACSGARARRIREKPDQARGGRSRSPAMMLIGQKAVLLTAMDDDPGALPERILALAVKTIAAVLVATLAVAGADLAWSRILWRRDNRMSKHEVKEELKQAEGDRMVKARLRSLRLDRRASACCRRCRARPWWWPIRPTTPSRCATCAAEGGAPIVLAKGVDLIALKICAIAEAHDIPVVEDKPLARSLYAAVEVERPIPGRILSRGRRDRASDPAEEMRMGPTKSIDRRIAPRGPSTGSRSSPTRSSTSRANCA